MRYGMRSEAEMLDFAMMRTTMWQSLSAAVCLAVLAGACPPMPAQTAPPNPETQTAPADVAPPAFVAPVDLPPASLAAQIADLVNDPSVARDHWGIMVTNLDGGLIFGLNQAQLFQPASNAKLFSTAAALALLGADHRFTTQVEAAGNLDKIGVSMDFLERRAGSGGNREITLSSIYQGKLFQGSMINTSDEFQGRIVMKNGASQFYAGGFNLMSGQDGKYTMILDGKINDDPSGGNTLAPIKARLSCVDLSI